MGYIESVEAAKESLLRGYLAAADGNVGRAAKLAGLNRQHFYKLAKQYGLPIPYRYNHQHGLLGGNMAWRSLG